MESTTRRRILKRAAAATAGLTVLPSARMVRGTEANSRLRLAIYGQMYNASSMMAAPHVHGAEIVALGDPDRSRIGKGLRKWDEIADRLEQGGKPETRGHVESYRKMARGERVQFFSDIRRLLDATGDSIDALVVSHYDHLHGVSCGPALRLGKPVLSERPLGLNISDARALRSLASETGLPTTYRSPGTASGSFRRALELVEDGFIGEVREVHVWFDRGGPNRGSLPGGTQPFPDELDWDAWLAPLPWREYHRDWMSYANWRETCSGGLGSFGPHTSIFPFLALRLPALWDRPGEAEPIRVTAECSSRNPISFPTWERVRWEIPAREGLPPVKWTWHHGPGFPPGTREFLRGKLEDFGVTSGQSADALLQKAGSLLVGAGGALLGNDHSTRVTALPTQKFEEVETDRPLRLPGSSNIYSEWIRACRGEEANILADFAHGGPLSELLMTGNIATRFPEERLAWDPRTGSFRNRAEANAHLGFSYREGWEL